MVKAPSFIVGLVLLGIGFARADALAQDAPAVPPGAESRTSNAQEASARGLFDEPGKLRKGIQFGARRMGGDETGERTTKSGFYPEMGNMVTGAGWISAGVGYRHWFAGNRAFVDASTGLSWRAYKMAQARFEVMPFDDERISFGTQIRWQDLTQVNYFGEGPDSLEANRSEYRLKSVNTVGYVTVRPREWLAVQGRLGWLAAPELLQPAGAFSRGNPSTVEVFPDDPVYRLSEQPDFLHSEAAVLVETRDVPGYPTRGGVYRIAASRYSDRDANRFTFNRYEAEAAHYIPLVSDNFVLALRGWVAGTTTAPNQHVPFYLAPSLGGSTTLRGFSDYRFHDRNVALLNTELRVAIFEHLDGVAFYDAGNVAARFGDLNLDHTSYGVGVRLHTDTATFARLDLARSVEGWEIVFRMNDPFKLSRWTKRTAHLPFAP